MAERAKDPLEHCQLILVLINKLPQSIDIQGVSWQDMVVLYSFQIILELLIIISRVANSFCYVEEIS